MSDPVIYQNLAPANRRVPFSVIRESERPHSHVEQVGSLLFDNRWLIFSSLVIAILASLLYLAALKPVYEANLLIHVEDIRRPPGPIQVGDLGAAGGNRTTANAEAELVRSRMVVASALDKLNVDTTVRPNFFPLVGRWLASQSWSVPFNGIASAYAQAGESLTLQVFNVPDAMTNQDLTVTAKGDGRFVLQDRDRMVSASGKVGALLKIDSSVGPIELLVTQLQARPGVIFYVRHSSKLAMVQAVQARLEVTELGRDSGVVRVSLQGDDPRWTSSVLSEIGRQYVAQNAARTTREADKALNFLETQLPQVKRQLDESESKYNEFRRLRGTIDIGEESRSSLQQIVQAKARKMELEQKRVELLVLFTPNHPSVIGVETQLRDINKEIGRMVGSIKSVPALEQELLSLSREVKSNSDTYASLLATARQLRLATAASTSNVRLIDWPMMPERPVPPQTLKTMAIAILGGLGTGLIAAGLRRRFKTVLERPEQIEQELALPIFAVIPHSDTQKRLSAKWNGPAESVPLLAKMAPVDPALDSLRIFRSMLQFALGRQKNNVVLITSPTEKLGKSFITANLATLVGAGGSRVLIIDADLRNGDIHQYFNTSTELGLSNVLCGQITARCAIHIGVVPGVDFLSRGDKLLNSSELLMQPAFGEMISALERDYNLILINGTSVLGMADAVAIGGYAGAIYLVARASISTRGEIADSIKLLMSAGLMPAGLLFNDARTAAHRARRDYSCNYQWQVPYRESRQAVVELPGQAGSA